MAKALLGYVGTDSRLLDDNQRLRRRVAELESLIVRLQTENDALACELHREGVLRVPDSIVDESAASAL